MTKPYTPDENPENLAALPLSEAEQHPEALRHIASTFDPTRGVLVDQLSAKGQKVITFNSILKYNSFPIAAIIKDLLTFGEKVMSTPIEIEFAGNLNRPDWKKPEFSLLQIRPIVTGSESADLQVKKAELERAFIVSHHVMGNGYCDTIKDIIYIKTERYNPAETAEMVLEIEKINTQFIANQSKYILIVAGRLGSSDPWLGIPVVWSQISQAAVIIETNLPEFQVEPSQGTHFFQNITSLGTIYLTVNPTLKDGKLDFNKISQFPCLGETNHFRHIQAEKPFIVKADGRNRIGIVAYFEEDFHSPNRQLG
jgi:hypothetical protein